LTFFIHFSFNFEFDDLMVSPSALFVIKKTPQGLILVLHVPSSSLLSIHHRDDETETAPFYLPMRAEEIS